MDYETFRQDKKTLKAVLYDLAMIGEAARKLPEEIAVRYPSIPWREMGDMRNIVIHEYFGVDTKIIWGTVTVELPSLVPLLKDIIAESQKLS